MNVTELTRDSLRYRRWKRDLLARGYEDITHGGRLWELHRGYRYDHRIVDVQVGPDGKSLMAKVEKVQ